jgi:hypothetical protein
MIENVRDFFKELPKEIRTEPFVVISRFQIYAIMLMSIITALVLLILFTVDGGFLLQIRQIAGSVDIFDNRNQIIEEPGFFSRVGAAFTTGRTATYFNTTSMIFFLVLFACSLITVHLAYIMEETGSKKVMMIILFSFIGLLGYIIPFVVFLLHIEAITVPTWLLETILNTSGDSIEYLFSNSYSNNEILFLIFVANIQSTGLFVAMPFIYIGVLLAFIIISSIVLAKCNSSVELIGKWWFALLLTFGIAPVAILLITIIIPLVVGGGAIVLICGAIFLVIKFFSGDSGGSGKTLIIKDNVTGKVERYDKVDD